MALYYSGGVSVSPRNRAQDDVAETGFYRTVTIDNTGEGSALTDYQVKVDVTYDADMQSDFSDVRFRDTDQTTLLDFWLQEYTSSTSATFWVKVPSISSTTTDIYMYYGDVAASGGSDITACMIQGDDFNRASLNNPSTWTKSSNNVLQSASYGDPDVWYEGGTFYVFVDDLASGDIRLLSSSDFESTSWTDEGIVLSRGAGGAWDDYTVRDPSVIKIGSTYYLYYAGADGTATGHAMGLATASAIDGPYTKDATDSGRILTKTGGFSEFDVFYDGSQYIVTYTDGNSPTADGTGTGQIGYATSADGFSWTDRGITIDDEDGIEWQDQTVIEVDGIYTMFLNSDATGGLYVAQSLDGINWGIPTTGGGVPVGSPGSYDDTTVFAPSLVEVSGTWYLYYQANDGVNQRLAVASASSIVPDKWFQTDSSFVITSNQLTKTGGAAPGNWARSEMRYYVEPPYIAEFHLNQTTATDAGYISGIYFGEDTSGLHYGVLLDYTGTDRIALWRNNLPDPGGSSTIVSTNTSFTLTPGVDYRFRVTVTSTTLSVDFYNGSWNNAVLSETRDMKAAPVGFYTYSNSTNNQFVSDFLFQREYVASEPTTSVGSEVAL